jgi:phosphate transport system permease protein
MLHPKLNKFLNSGTLFVWLCGAGLATSLLMIVGLLLLIMVNGLGYFWPNNLVELQLHDKTFIVGEITNREIIPDGNSLELAEEKLRLQLKIGNRDLYGLDFTWIDEDQVQSRRYPQELVAIERREWGDFYGRLVGIKKEEKLLVGGGAATWNALGSLVDQANEIHDQIHYIEQDLIGDVNYDIEQLRLELRGLEQEGLGESVQAKNLQADMTQQEKRYQTHSDKLQILYAQLNEHIVEVQDASGQIIQLPVGNIVQIHRPNNMNVWEKSLTYLSNVWVVLSDDPREANTEGGIFPAIFGTVLMVIIMSIAVVPFGVLAAFYLKEYARQGMVVKMVRIAVNNLAGVPSIVFGVFGLGFFVYAVGGSIDSLFYSTALPNPTFGTGGIFWASLTLALMTVPVVIVATEEGLSAVPREYREGSLALGATKFESLIRVVLPCAMPGILTGLILAISRATGEVAPLMLTGVVKLAPSLPLDGYFPFLHLDRKFMHLGFHIYDVGFQSPNVEAAKPMVYVTTLILVMVVILLNMSAIALRNRMRKKYSGSHV